MGMVDEDEAEDEQDEEEAFSEIKKTFDFSLAITQPQEIAEAILQPNVNEQLKSIGETLQIQTSLLREPGSELRKQGEKIASSLTDFAPALNKGFTAYSDAFKSIFEGIKGYNVDDVLAPVHKLALDYGWPPLYRLTPRSLQFLDEEANKLGDEAEKQRYIDERITENYQDDELNLLLADWEREPLLKGTDRLRILSDAFEAHKEGKYSLSSPAVLPQIEGLFIDYLEPGRKKGIGTGQYKKHVNRLRKKPGRGSLSEGLAQALYEFVEIHGLFGNEVPTNPISAVSRHAILHGRSTVYAEREDISLRHLLWLDCVIHLINSLTPQAGKGEEKG